MAALSGVLFALAFPPVACSGLAWIALIPLLVAVDAAPPALAFVLGWSCGAILYVAGVPWIPVAAKSVARLSWPASLGLFTAGAAQQGSYVGLFALGISLASKRAMVLLAPIAWVGTEWIAAQNPLTFPWIAFGSSQYRVLPIIQTAELGGVYAVSALLVAVNAAGFRFLTRRPLGVSVLVREVAPVAIAVAIVALWGSSRIAQLRRAPSGGTLRVGVVQPNVDQGDKASVANWESLLYRLETLSRSAVGQGAELVVWPESVLPFPFEDGSEWVGKVMTVATSARANVLLGAHAFKKTTGRLEEVSRAYFVGHDGRVTDLYDKRHLVPVGEYSPWRGVRELLAGDTGWGIEMAAGSSVGVMPMGMARLGVLICYEGVMPELSRELVERGATVVVNIANDSWFDGDWAPRQHLAMVAMRAVESRVAVVRAASTGISAVVSADGRIGWQSALGEIVGHTETVQWKGYRTVYVRFGYLFAPACAAALVALLVGGVARSGGEGRRRKRAAS